MEKWTGSKLGKDYFKAVYCHSAYLTYRQSAAKSLQSCPTLCDPIDGSPLGSSGPRILQARILEWVAISFSNACMHAKSLQLCPTLWDHMEHLFKNFLQFVVIHTVKGFGIVNRMKQMFFWNSLAFSMIQQMLAI